MSIRAHCLAHKSNIDRNGKIKQSSINSMVNRLMGNLQWPMARNECTLGQACPDATLGTSCVWIGSLRGG